MSEKPKMVFRTPNLRVVTRVALDDYKSPIRIYIIESRETDALGGDCWRQRWWGRDVYYPFRDDELKGPDDCDGGIMLQILEYIRLDRDE